MATSSPRTSLCAHSRYKVPGLTPLCRSGAHSVPVNPSHADSVVSVYASQIQAAEKESVEMQERHSQLTEEKERLLKSLLEAE